MPSNGDVLTPRIQDCVAVLHIDVVDKAVLNVVIKHADFATGTGAHPGVKRIVFYVQKAERTIQTSLRRLVVGGWIEVQAEAYRDQATTYRVRFDRIRFEAARVEAAYAKAKAGRREKVVATTAKIGTKQG